MDLFNPDFFMDRGGLVGALEYWAISSLFSGAGAHLAFLVGISAGLLLATGTSVASVVSTVRGFARWCGARARGVGDAVAGERQLAQEDALGFPPEEPEVEFRVEALEPPAPPVLEEEEQQTAEHDLLEHEPELDPIAEDPLEQVERDVAATEGAALTPQGLKRSSITESEEISYSLPDPSILRRSPGDTGPDTSNQDAVAKHLVETLGHFGIEAQLVGRVAGPRVTRHELRLAPGTKVSKVTQLKDDLAYALASTDIRILAPIPGKQAVGVEVPNKRHRMVYLGDIFERELGQGNGKKGTAPAAPLAVWLGKDISGQSIWTDLARMPHVLVAGTTGSGKSGCVNAMLSSVLLRSSPNEVRLVLVDPKRVELNHYEDIPHLLTPVVTAPRMAANVLGNLISEMESRYEVMGAARARNITEMNQIRRTAGESVPPSHPVRDRRARRPDDGRARRGRGLDHPPGAEVTRGGDPPRARDSAPVGGHHHRHDQGERARADRIRCLVAARLPRDSRRRWRRVSARPGRHALPRSRFVQAAADPGRLHHRR